MATKNEAVVKFKADTKEFTSGIASMNQEMSTLRGSLKLNAAELKANGSSVDLLKERQELLSQRLADAKQKVELTSNILAVAKERFGENSRVVHEWEQKLLSAQLEVQNVSGELNSVSSQLDKAAAEASAAESALGKLTQTISVQETELADLKKQYMNAVLEYGETSDEAQTLAARITDLSGELRANRETLSGVENAADNLSSTVDNAGASADQAASGGFTTLDATIADLASSTIKSGISALKDLGSAAIDAAQELDEGYDIIITKTGASGEALDDLNAIAKQVYGSLPVEMSDVGTAVGEVNTRFESTGEELQELSALFLEFANINGTDVNNSIDTVDKIMNQWSIDTSDAANVLGLLTDAGQKTGISVDSLMSSISDNSSTFKQLNLSFEQSVGLLAQLEANGVDTSTAVAGLKKAVANLTDAGMSEEEALASVIDSIKNAATETEALSIAQDTFGTKGAAEMSIAIREGRLDMETLTSSMEDYGSTVEGTFNATLDPWDDATVAINNLKTAGATLATNALTVVQPALDQLVVITQSLAEWTNNASQFVAEHQTALTLLAVAVGTVSAALIAYNAAQSLANAGAIAAGTIQAGETAAITASTVALGLHTTATTIATAATSAFGAVMAFVTSPITLVIVAIGALIAIGVALYKNWDTVKEIASSVWEGIKTAVTGAITAAKDTVTNVVEELATTLSDIWNTIVTAVSSAFETVKNVVTSIATTLSDIWNTIVAAVSSAFETVKNVIQVAIMFIGSLISAAVTIITLPWQFIWQNCHEYIETAWEAIKNTVSAAITAVQETINTVLSTISSIVMTVWDAVSSATSAAWEAIKNTVSAAITAVQETISTVLSTISSIVMTVWDAVSSATSAAWEAIKSAVSTAITAVQTTINTVLSAISSAAMTAWNAISSAANVAWTTVKTTVTTIVNSVKTTVSSVFSAIKSVVTGVWSETKTATMTVWNGIKTSVSTTVSGIKSTVTNVWDGIKTVTTNVWTSIKTAILTPVNAAVTAVKTAVDKIKGFFSGLTLKLPSIKLPHFKLTGSFSLVPPSVPKLTVDWYAKGGVLTQPTIFGAMGSSLLGGGEAGPEAVAPIDVLQGYVADAVSAAFERSLGGLTSLLAAVADRPIVLTVNGKEMMLATAGDADSVYGSRQLLTDRGVAL